jgi:hypothetical protein
MKFNWKLKIKDAYVHLLMILILSFLVWPFVQHYNNTFGIPMLSFVFLLGIVFPLRTLNLRRSIFLPVVFFGIVCYLCELAVGVFEIEGIKENFKFIAMAFYGLFLLLSVVLMVHKMFSADEITSDMILGGVCIYILMGLLWAIFYDMIYLFDANAFHFSEATSSNSMFYYSFTVLTTVGFGDIYPINNLARSLSSLEAVSGQMYIAIFISRLVSLHIIHKSRK